MKQVGEKLTWNTVNGPMTGTVEKVSVMYVAKTEDGYVIVNDDKIVE